MKKIDVSSILPGSAAAEDLYSEKGELLIAKGTVLSQQYIDALTRRNIFEVHLKAGDEEEEIKRLISREFTEPEEINIDGPAARGPKNKKRKTARKIPLPDEFKGLKPGEDGARQLVDSARALRLDKLLADGLAPDMPAGVALRRMARQIGASERTPQHIGAVSASYADAISSSKSILEALSDGVRIGEDTVRGVVDRFVKTYLTDKSILINISNTKAWEGEYLYNHMLNVCLLAINIAAAVHYSREQIVEIGIGALLHDVGMLLVPEDIRFKKGRLTRDEWFEIQKHAILGLHVLEKYARVPETAKFVAYQVHERENGKGYPKQRAGRFVHKFAKIVQVADIFESLCSPREYRLPYTPYRAMEILIKMSNQNLVSSDYVKAFLAYASLFPIGSIVELSDGRIAKVVQGNELNYTRPVVSVIADRQGPLLDKSQVYQVDLSADAGIRISKALEQDKLPDIDLMFGF
jgi:HD-GYP domain-containing protein (c-di-GMP phosphodiesterase class II)